MSTRELGPESGRPAMGWAGEDEVRRGYLKLGALAALLLIEILALTLRFDARTIKEGVRALSDARASGGEGAGPVSEWIVWFFEHSSVALAMGIAAASATLLFGGRQLREGLARAADSSWGGRSWPMLVGHFTALAAFWWLTTPLFEGGAIVSPWDPGWIVTWAASGLAVVISLIATALPPPSWGLLAGRGLRAITVGLVVALSAIAAGLLARRLWMPLGRWTLEAVHGLLGWTGTALIYEPSRFVVGTESFSVEIAPQCSGYEGIGLVWAFLGAYIWFCRRQLRFPRAWLLLPLGTVAILLANVLRITALILVGTWLSADIAAGGFHSQAGWLGFNAVALGLILLAQRGRFFRRDEGPRVGSVAGTGREAVYLAPMLAIVAVTMVCGAFSTGGSAPYYPARLAAVALPLWLYRREYAAMRWTCSWQAPAIGLLVFTLWVARWPADAGGSTARSMMAAAGGVAWTAAWLSARVIGSVVTVPIAEELAFRGFLTRRLIAADFDAVSPGRFTWTSFAISSVAFGVLHDRWLEGTMAGMLYALAYYRRGSLGDAVSAHATTNALLCVGALMTGDWSLFS